MQLAWLYEVSDKLSGRHYQSTTAHEVAFSNQRLSMTFFPGRTVELDLEQLSEPILGTYSLTGTVVGDGNGSVVLTIGNREIEGKIDAFGSSYVIRTLDPAIGNTGTARVEILELDPAVLHSYEGRDLSLPGPKRSKRSSSVEKAGSAGKATVLILYTSAVSQERNMDSFASSIIASLNSALSTAAVGKSTLLAGTVLVNLTETHVCTDMNHLLNRTDGVVDNIDTLMSDYGADTAVLIIDDDLSSSGDCSMPDYPGRTVFVQGLAPRGVAPIFDVANRFAVVQDDFALGDFTFAHELGHVLGGDHTPFDKDGDRNVAEESQHGSHSFSRGWFNATAWQTMMGGYEMCPMTNVFCSPRLNRFSNPDQTTSCSGLPCGVSIGNADQADMRTSLQMDWNTIVAWEADPPVPGSPLNVNVDPLQCFGGNLVLWNAPSSGGPAAEYEDYRSSNQSFSPQYLVYSGTSTATGVTLNSQQSPSYIRVRACNADGCGGYANGDNAATYTSGCF